MNTSKKYSAFTLVELIVVIVILAILATIAFLSFSNQSSSARDSTRLSDISNIAKGLGVNQAIGGKYPLPDKKVSVSSSAGAVIGYQGDAGSTVLGIIKFSVGGGLDPLDKVYYTYSTNLTQNKYQLLTFLENQNNVVFDFSPFNTISQSFATDYVNRYAFVKGDQLAMILKQSTSTIGTNSGSVVYTPIQDISSIQTSGTGFVVTDATVNTGMVAVVNNSSMSSGVSVSSLVGFTSLVNPVVNSTPSTLNANTDFFNLSDNDLKGLFVINKSDLVKSWTTNLCTGALSIQNITDATNFNSLMNGKTLSGFTIYKVSNGIYNVTGEIYLNKCTAIVGESRAGTIFKRGFDGVTSNAIIRQLGQNNSIIASLSVDGNKTNFTSTNNNGVYITASVDNTFVNIDSFNNVMAGLYVGGNRNSTYNSQFFNNGYFGILSLGGLNNNIIDVQAYSNAQVGIQLQGASNGILKNIKTYNNTFRGIQVYSNANNNSFNNIETYNNGSVGIWFVEGSNNNVVNNMQSFNNGDAGLFVVTSINNSFNNISIFNNAHRGIMIQEGSSNNLLNNVSTFNSGQNGLYIWFNSNNILLNNIKSYNNLGVMYNDSTNTKYFGILKIFGNSVNTNPLAAGTGSLLLWNDGTLDNTGSMDCSYHSQPNIIASWSGCTAQGRQTATNVSSLSYVFGSNISNQIRPVKWNGTAFVLYGVDGTDYDTGKKIGQW